MMTMLTLAVAMGTLTMPQDFDPDKFVEPGRNKVALTPSPNFNDRPADAVVDTIVLHHTAGDTLKGVVKWFAMTESQVSSHFTVGKDGSIVMHVNPFYRAWHAGNSVDARGIRNVNNYSVGIEIVNRGDGTDPWRPEQVEAVRLLCGYLVRHRYAGQIKQIVSHEFIAVPTGRKNDPLNYPWDSLKDLADEFHLKLDYGKPNPPHEANN